MEPEPFVQGHSDTATDAQRLSARMEGEPPHGSNKVAADGYGYDAGRQTCQIHAAVGDASPSTLEVEGSLTFWMLRSHLLQLHLESVATSLPPTPPRRGGSGSGIQQSSSVSRDPDDWELHAVVTGGMHAQPPLVLYPSEDDDDADDDEPTTLADFLQGNYNARRPISLAFFSLSVL